MTQDSKSRDLPDAAVSSGDDLPSKSTINNRYFQKDGQSYASFRPTYPAALAAKLAALLPERTFAVDVGCGSGQLSSLLSPLFKTVVGVDPSEAQLAQARIRLKHLTNLSFEQRSAEHTALPDCSVDLVVAAQSAHWFDLPAFYREVRRITRDHGVLALVSYGVPYITHWVNTVFQQGYWQGIHEFWPPERAQVEDGYVNLPFPFPSVELPDFEYTRKMTVSEFIGYMRTWSAFENAVNRGCQDRFEAFFAALRRAWPAPVPQQVAWPLVVKAGYVHL